MRSGNKRLYEKNDLQTLVNQKYSCITSKLCERKIELQAKYLKEVKLGIKEALDKGLNKYDYSLNGILLDYRSLHVLEDKYCGRIVGKCGEFIISIKAEFYVFQPEIGDLLKGVVNVKSDSHVGCLVHKCFNAMILKPENVDSQSWNCKNIQIGDEIIFKIVDHVFSGHVPYIEGTISDDQMETMTKKKKSKKKKHDSLPLEHSEQNGYCSNEDLMKGIGKTMKEFDDENVRILDIVEKAEEKPFLETSKKKRNSGIQEKEVYEYANNSYYDCETLSNAESNLSEIKKKKKKKSKNKKDHDNETIYCPEQGEEPISQLHNSAIVSNLKEIGTEVNKESGGNMADSESLKSRKKKKTCGKEKVAEIHESNKLLEIFNEKVDGFPGKKKKKKDKDKEKGGKEKESSNVLEKGKTSTDEIGSTAELIDSLMKIVPAELITPEVTPKKPASPICTKQLTAFECEKTPIKQILSSTNKRKRNESIAEYEAKAIADNASSPSSKKMLLEETLKSPKQKRSHERSLFSDSEASLQSSKRVQIVTPPKAGQVCELNISAGDKCQYKNTGEQEVILLDQTKKSKKRKRDKSQEEEGKSEKNKNKNSDIEKNQTYLNEMKVSPKKEKQIKSSSKTKVLPDNTKTISESFQGVPSTNSGKNENSKTGMSISKEKILNKDDPGLSEPLPEKVEVPPSKANSKASKKQNSQGLKKKNGEATKNLKRNVTNETILTKTLPLGNNEFDNPVLTSTPKLENKEGNSETKKNKKRKTNGVKSGEINTKEKEEMINALLQNVRLSLGMNDDKDLNITKSEEKKKNYSITKYLVRKEKEENSPKRVQNNLSKKETLNTSGSNSGLNSVV